MTANRVALLQLAALPLTLAGGLLFGGEAMRHALALEGFFGLACMFAAGLILGFTWGK